MGWELHSSFRFLGLWEFSWIFLVLAKWDEVEVMGLKGFCLVSQQEESVQLLCPQQTDGMWQLRLF